MAMKITTLNSWTVLVFLFATLCLGCNAKLTESVDGILNKTVERSEGAKIMNKIHSNSGLILADELRLTLERYLFGICPQSYKMPLMVKARNTTTATCDVDAEHNDLAGRLASLALRAHSAARSECSQLATALANTFSDLARTSATRQVNSANEANKKRKLSKSQKAKIQAKQRTALAVKKKAAAVAAAAAAKMAS